MQRMPLTIGGDAIIRPYPGGKSTLVKKIIDEFCPRFTPGGVPVYVADEDGTGAYSDADYLRSLGVVFGHYGKMPDVVIHFAKRDWLFLIEAVTGHGAVGANRVTELISLFTGSKAELVFVTAIPSRRGLSKYLGEVAWGTNVWVASEPDHMIHFNDNRLLRPF